MSYTEVCIHYVWSTKYREPVLEQPYRKMLFDHMRQNALDKNIYIDRINGYLDHVHCLVWLKNGQTIDIVAKLMKGEASFWFNNKSGSGRKVSWQKGYFAVSVSLHMVEKVRGYIDRQEAHHSKAGYAAEYTALMKQCLRVPGLENLSDE